MYNYVCVAEENPWLAALDVPALNDGLRQQRERCEALAASVSHHHAFPTPGVS